MDATSASSAFAEAKSAAPNYDGTHWVKACTPELGKQLLMLADIKNEDLIYHPEINDNEPLPLASSSHITIALGIPIDNVDVADITGLQRALGCARSGHGVACASTLLVGGFGVFHLERKAKDGTILKYAVLKAEFDSRTAEIFRDMHLAVKQVYPDLPKPFFDYNPHVTVAYLKPEASLHYASKWTRGTVVPFDLEEVRLKPFRVKADGIKLELGLPVTMFRHDGAPNDCLVAIPDPTPINPDGESDDERESTGSQGQGAGKEVQPQEEASDAA